MIGHSIGQDIQALYVPDERSLRKQSQSSSDARPHVCIILRLQMLDSLPRRFLLSTGDEGEFLHNLRRCSSGSFKAFTHDKPPHRRILRECHYSKSVASIQRLEYSPRSMLGQIENTESSSFLLIWVFNIWERCRRAHACRHIDDQYNVTGGALDTTLGDNWRLNGDDEIIAAANGMNLDIGTISRLRRPGSHREIGHARLVYHGEVFVAGVACELFTLHREG